MDGSQSPVRIAQALLGDASAFMGKPLHFNTQSYPYTSSCGGCAARDRNALLVRALRQSNPKKQNRFKKPADKEPEKVANRLSKVGKA